MIKRIIDRAAREASADDRATIATAINIGGDSHSSATAYSDDDIVIVTIDGETVTRRRPGPAPADQ